MAEQRMKVRDKKVQKMTKDGLVEENLTDKSSVRVSNRVGDVQMGRKQGEKEENLVDKSPRQSERSGKNIRPSVQKSRDAPELIRTEKQSEDFGQSSKQQNRKRIRAEVGKESRLAEESEAGQSGRLKEKRADLSENRGDSRRNQTGGSKKPKQKQRLKFAYEETGASVKNDKDMEKLNQMDTDGVNFRHQKQKEKAKKFSYEEARKKKEAKQHSKKAQVYQANEGETPGKKKSRLKFGEGESVKTEKTSVVKKAGSATSVALHREISKNEDDNAAVEGAHKLEESGEGVYRLEQRSARRRKQWASRKRSRLERQEEKEKVAECYKQWLESKSEILHFYKDADAEQLPLSEQKELKSIKNMVIREAVRYGEGYLYTEDEGLEALETEREEMGADDSEVSEDMVEVPVDYSEDEPEEEEPDGQEFYAKWTDAYKEAREYLYGTPQIEPDEEAAYEIMKEEAGQGNAYAMADMGKMYAQGIFVEADKTKAQEWYEKSLKAMLVVEDRKENTYLEYRIGKMYQYGLGTEENLPEATKWFEIASGKEHKYALYSLGMLYLHGKGVEQDEGKACQLFQRSHKKGNPYASFELGKLYEAGRGTQRNTDLAEKCYRVAFLGFLNLEKKSRDDTLWYRIGTMYLQGVGTEADEKEAEKYLCKSAGYGNTHAAYQLAKLYIRQETEKLQRNPKEIPDYKKIKQVLKWLEAASEQGNSFADYALGKLYTDGELIAKDMEKAFHHLHKAADADNAYAWYRLGRLYLSDEYKDIGRAVRYLTLAANRKNEFASYRLGKLYLAGEEVVKNVELAIRYLEESAGVGNQYAQYVLGKVNLMGREVEQDKEKAYEYFRLAAEQGNVYAAYFLEHWNDMPHPDLLLMATRLMHHLEKIMEDDVSGKKGGRRAGMDRKLARKIKNKKIAQGHARDDREEMVQTQ